MSSPKRRIETDVSSDKLDIILQLRMDKRVLTNKTFRTGTGYEVRLSR